MKASIEWLKEFSEIDVSGKELGDILTMTGSKLETIEERGKDIIEKEEVIAQKEEVVAQKEEAVAQKEEEIIKREGKIEQREKYIKMREENINKTKDNFIIGMIKSRIDESTILEITRIDKKELDKIKEKYNLAVVN